MTQPLSTWRRWRIHRDIERQFGLFARKHVENLTDSGLMYYIGYRSAGIDHIEAMRLAGISQQIGDDATNYDEYRLP